MKNLIATYLFLLLTCACNEKRSAIEGRVTKVVPHFELQHWRLPHVTFHILIDNPGSRVDTLYIQDYGRSPAPHAGSFWVYYNNKTDSLQLFSASCENCREKTIMHPGDSVSVILRIPYMDVAKQFGSEDDAAPIDDEIKKVFDTWSVVKYFDSNNAVIFEARKQN